MPERARPEALTWTALLGRWVEFAKASVALPEDVEGRRWKDSVVPVIELQAVTFALADLDRLAPSERALGLDRAEILIDRAQARLGRAWEDQAMPPSLEELLTDARAALTAAQATP